MARNKDYKNYLEKATQDMEKTKQQLEDAKLQENIEALKEAVFWNSSGKE